MLPALYGSFQECRDRKITTKTGMNEYSCKVGIRYAHVHYDIQTCAWSFSFFQEGLGVPKRLGNFGCSILKNGNHHDIRSIKKASWNTMVSNVSRKLKKTFLQNNLQSWLINLIAGQFWRTHPGFSRTPVIINAGHVLLGLQRCGHLFFGEWEIWAYHGESTYPPLTYTPKKYKANQGFISP